MLFSSQRTTELHTLEDNLNPSSSSKTRSGSDGDSGVLVTTVDEQPEVFVSENGEVADTGERRPSNTPTTSSTSPNLNGEAADEGL